MLFVHELVCNIECQVETCVEVLQSINNQEPGVVSFEQVCKVHKRRLSVVHL